MIIDRTYKTANGMTKKTANAKQSWANGNADLHVLHMTRRGAFWLECIGADGVAIAKDIDRVDAKDWLEGYGFELPEVLR